MFKHCIFLDAGHGGRETSGCYTTAPSKMWDLKKGTFHNGSIFYEGVKNREYADIIAAKLVSKGINVVKIYHPWLDTPLSKRVEIANYYNSTVQPGIFFSEHSNATNGNGGRGFSIWTSIGQTKSDILANEFVKMYKEDLSDDINKYSIVMEDTSDGDSDYEENFYVLRETDMPALLAENLFFDQYDDAMILMDSYYKEQYVNMVCEWAMWSVNYMDNNG